MKKWILDKLGLVSKKELGRVMHKPDGALIHEACFYFRHDYGLLPIEEQKKIAWEAKEWLYSWSKAMWYN